MGCYAHLGNQARMEYPLKILKLGLTKPVGPPGGGRRKPLLHKDLRRRLIGGHTLLNMWAALIETMYQQTKSEQPKILSLYYQRTYDNENNYFGQNCHLPVNPPLFLRL